MGREIKRVPLDFDAPVGEAWAGYQMPDTLHGDSCPDCKGGQTYAGWWLQHMCQRLAMLADDVADQGRGRPMHPWLTNDPYPPTDSTHLFERATQVLRPSPDFVTLIDALTGESRPRLGGRDGHGLFAAIVNASGLEDWGSCLTCEGEGTAEAYPGQRDEARAWQCSEPPEGPGWQMWQTVSDGPISPVFADAEGLIEWMTTPASKWGAMGPWTRDQAAAFVNGPGWAPTFISSAAGVQDGVTAVSS